MMSDAPTVDEGKAIAQKVALCTCQVTLPESIWRIPLRHYIFIMQSSNNTRCVHARKPTPYSDDLLGEDLLPTMILRGHSGNIRSAPPPRVSAPQEDRLGLSRGDAEGRRALPGRDELVCARGEVGRVLGPDVPGVQKTWSDQADVRLCSMLIHLCTGGAA